MLRRMKRGDWFLAVFFLTSGVICIRLGIWQLNRLEERRSWNASVRDQMALPALNLETGDSPPEDLVYRRVVVEGEWLTQDEILLRNRSYNDQPGYHLVTPLQPQGLNYAILVDRGWVPIDAGEPDGLLAYQENGRVVIQGFLLPSDQEPGWTILADPTLGPGSEPLRAWRVLSIDRISEQLAYRLFPYYIGVDDSGEQRVTPPIPDPGIDLSEGPHLGYAIQWFSFAAIAVIGGGFWLRRRVDRRQFRESES